MVWIANMEIGLNPYDSVIKRMLCIANVYSISAQYNTKMFFTDDLFWFDFCFMALQHILGHFGHGQLP